MSNDFAAMMRNGFKLPPEAKDATGRLHAYNPTPNDRELVRVLAANGVQKEVICKLIHIQKRTLYKYYREELDDGCAMVTAKVGAALVKEAMSGNVAAQRYWLGTHGGPTWRIPKTSDLMPDADDEPNERVHFYMPSNHRDEPEQIEGPVIEGTVDEPDPEPGFT